MDFLIKIRLLIVIVFVSGVLYYWSGAFKKIGASTMDELNEDDEKEEDLVNESETKFINYFGTITFVLVGVFSWSILGVSVGKFASELTPNIIINRIGYVFVYFFFLRFPFGVLNKMLKRSYEVEFPLEKILFSISMISFYVLGICCYDSLPDFLTWHLDVLGSILN